MTEEVKNIEEILLPKYMGSNEEIIQCNSKKLMAPGENYGSVMLAIEIKIRDKETSKERILDIVAKAAPRNEFIQRMFQTPLTFKKELEFYRTIIPALQEFQRDNGIGEVMDFFPEFYGGRMGLNPDSDDYDDDAVILMENLKEKGYFCEDRTIGFDLDTAKYILKDLATLHAVPLALKLKNPEVFKKKILPHINTVKVFDRRGDILNAILDGFINIAKENEDCVPVLPGMREKLLKSAKLTKNPPEPREPFGTLIHKDFWVNNTMIKLKDGKIVGNKIVDFQMQTYGSPARDLTFFIFDSVQNEVVEKYYDYLVEFYHKNLVETLLKFDVDTEPFSIEAFKEEIDLTMQEFTRFQCFVMLKPIFATKGTIKDLEHLNEQDMARENQMVPQEQKEKLWLLVKEFSKRKWL